MVVKFSKPPEHYGFTEFEVTLKNKTAGRKQKVYIAEVPYFSSFYNSRVLNRLLFPKALGIFSSLLADIVSPPSLRHGLGN